MLTEVYHLNGMAESVDFVLSASAGHTSCLDDPTCEGEKYILCFRDLASDIGKGMDYLACVDKLGKGAAWPAKNAQCAPQSSVSASAVETCLNSNRSTELLKEAVDYFWNYWGPDSTAVPRLMINNQTFLADWTTEELLQALCGTGIGAPACSAGPSPSPGPGPPSPPAPPVPAGECDFFHGYIPYTSGAGLGTQTVKFEQQCCDACKSTKSCSHALHKISTGGCSLYTSDAVAKFDQGQTNYWVCKLNSNATVVV